MANDDNRFSWSQFWSAWSQQPVEIQRQWMVWKVHPVTGEESGLKPVLENVVEFCPFERDEIFRYAPLDVQKYFGYEVVEEEKVVKSVKQEYVLSPKRREQLAKLLES